jgi:FeS assembly protein SufD
MVSLATSTVTAPGSASAAWLESVLRVFEPSRPAAVGESAGGLDQGRAAARDYLRRAGPPPTRQEAWRFTSLAPLLAVPPQVLPAPGLALAADHPPDGEVLRLYWDGVRDPLAGVDLPEGLTRLETGVQDALLGTVLQAAGTADSWLVRFNAALAGQVLALRVRGSVSLPLELVSDCGHGTGVRPLRLLLLLEEDASLDLLQVHRAAGSSLTSVVVEAQLKPRARLRHGVLAQGSDASCLLAHLAVSQATASELDLTTVAGGWGLARLEPAISQVQGAAATRLRGLQVARDRQIVDLHSIVRFEGPEGQLDQLQKAVVDDAGRSVFHGAVQVPQAAQRTNASQLSRNLLLSDRARVDAIPQLEIVADDVRCTHGATVTRLQQEELFYLRSRGLGADQAARLLLAGFCDEILAGLPESASRWKPATALLGTARPR